MSVAPDRASLRQILDLRISEVLGYDAVAGVMGAVGGAVLAGRRAETLDAAAAVAAGFVGVVIGAVIAGVAVQAAFMDEAFLRKTRRIGRDPVYFSAPLLFTVVLGVMAALSVLVLVAIPRSAPTWLLSALGASSGLFVVWTVVSLLPCLRTVADFALLKFDAAEVPED